MSSVLALSWAALKVSYQCCIVGYKSYNKCVKKEEEEDSDSNLESDSEEKSDSEENSDFKEKSDSKEKSEHTTKTKKKARKKKKSRSADAKSIRSNNIELNTTLSPVINNSIVLPSLALYSISQAGTQQASTQFFQSTENSSFEASGQGIVEWIPSNMEEKYKLIDKAVVGGYDIDETDLWVIRSRFKGEVIPGKLNYHHNLAFAVHFRDGEYREKNVFEFEVCCADPERIKWIKCSNGEVLGNAVRAGRRSGETLYVGRAIHNDEQHSDRKSLCPGFIQPSHGVLYVTYNYDFHAHKFYEVMCVE